MEWTGLNELREKFLSFFESKGHTRLPSYSLVPHGDKSLLLINSGMAPMKKFFLGQETPPNTRVTTCQKCIRTPDIENVGKTARHGTFFEMLGNFSFGDYFKHEAIRWAWEFFTEVLEIPVDRLWVTIYLDDDEAFDIWTKEIGVAPERVVRMGKEDNFWEHGSGPCGPCSEIYFDRGEEYGCGKPDCGVGCECDRYVEVWNLVFSQFDSDGKGNYTPLDHPNIDTGMGLERLACVMQGVNNLFEVDTIQNIMKHISRIAGKHYGENEKDDISLRVITDHIRSTVFMVADGVSPTNEGRGYVLRRLLRRAARHGRLLGINHPFLYEVVETVIQENHAAYPELAEKADYIKKVVKLEEERFTKTIDQGMEMLSSLIDKIDSHMEDGAIPMLPGAEAFRLYDTFGFPIDLTKEIIAERGIEVDEEEFTKLMEEQRVRARTARLQNGIVSWSNETEDLLAGVSSEFLGYSETECEGKILCMVHDGEKVVTASEGDEIGIVLDKTVFYTESGGQVSDTGLLKKDGCVIDIYDCKKVNGAVVHLGRVVSGSVAEGDAVTAVYDYDRRQAIRRNHTSAHLVQAALRHVLGDHVHQAGSYVDDQRMRFDFSHFSAMTSEEIAKVEREVNEVILKGADVVTKEMPIDEAKKMGAMALFGEKYGEIVRVVDVPGFSVEFCGGTHIDNTAKIGLFKILTESSVAAGVRRIEAVTGYGVLELLERREQEIHEIASKLKLSNVEEIPAKVEALSVELKAKDREIEALNQKIADSKVDGLFEEAQDIDGISCIVAGFGGTTKDALRTVGDKVKDRAPDAVALLSAVEDGKGTLLAVCGKNAVARGVHAGNLVKQIAALAGGKGGGRPDSAMAGIGDLFKLDEAIAKAPEIIRSMMKK